MWESVPTDNISARENLRASIATLEFVLPAPFFTVFAGRGGTEKYDRYGREDGEDNG